MGHQILGCCNSARIQRAGEGTGQSAGNAGHNMIECGGILRAFDFATVFLLVEVLDAAVDPKMDGVVKVFQLGCSMGAGMFPDCQIAGIGYSHGHTSFTTD